MRISTALPFFALHCAYFARQNLQYDRVQKDHLYGYGHHCAEEHGPPRFGANFYLGIYVFLLQQE